MLYHSIIEERIEYDARARWKSENFSDVSNNKNTDAGARKYINAWNTKYMRAYSLFYQFIETPSGDASALRLKFQLPDENQ